MLNECIVKLLHCVSGHGYVPMLILLLYSHATSTMERECPYIHSICSATEMADSQQKSSCEKKEHFL